MLSGACLSLHLNPLLTQGQIEALEHHASDEIKELYLPKLISGEWTGTMNLTEPQAGSDVGALSSKAEPLGDGSFAITGQGRDTDYSDADLLPIVTFGEHCSFADLGLRHLRAAGVRHEVVLEVISREGMRLSSPLKSNV